MIVSEKAKNISPSLTLAITAKAKQMAKEGIDIISFGAGEPDFDTPVNIKEAAKKAIDLGLTRYTPASGIIELKRAIIEKFKKDNNLFYTIDQVIVSTGAKQCLSNVFQAVLNYGDEVLIPVPYWVSYPELVRLYGGVPIFVECQEKDNFKYTIEAMEKKVSDRTKCIIINSPNNPTGVVYSKEELLAIADFAKRHDLLIISDEIYEKLIYEDNIHISIASLNEDAYKRTIVVNGVSKSYAMTGWRIGYAAGDEHIIKLMSSIQSHTTSNPTSVAQYAALEALTGPQEDLYNMVKEFEKRKNYMINRINSINNLSCISAEGAFYIMLNVSKYYGRKIDNKVINNSMEFAECLLSEEKVAVIPGIAFGLDDYVRLSYAVSMKEIEIGLNRIENFISQLLN
ncbi:MULTISPECIES: pyridoxal phosphate-dependent aminotransferase [Clostridium]|uniref:Aminotransferase n=1 Tax=Clostridium colicanis DSM 13634 TaxID=1121305 RepID=A0A151AQF7_9CLOT|nr:MULTISPECIES: pyridoxal phosphate-dependent aminotransferase [Clostridium]KYH29868.1 aspartate aminotransferase [Clostridium colicanis DSM 13634]MBE6042677.1 pyridoxal phosphate-dependent aminotransferase [Clostridium thermopalmarium]MBE6079022.1 pyridoxal phosphate-dependent aminotransferase [Clostridium lundense]